MKLALLSFGIVLSGLIPGCAAIDARGDPPEAGPRLRILGTAQDGGLPHAGCSCERCEADASGATPDRNVASLALLIPDGDATQIHLVDCTPDIREQLRLLRDVRFENVGGVDRALIESVFLTHAHMGHYSGLLHLGYEAMHSGGVQAIGTPRMIGFLEQNAPWSQLVEMGEIKPRAIEAGESIMVGGVRVTLIAVPHREEFSDTIAYRFEGAAQSVLYMPDCDPWHRWESRALELIDSVDVAILDATFFDGAELPGRDLSKIGHPLVVDTIALLAERVRSGRLRVILTHMNHTNPLLEPDSDARRRALEAGFEIAGEGVEIPL